MLRPLGDEAAYVRLLFVGAERRAVAIQLVEDPLAGSPFDGVAEVQERPRFVPLDLGDGLGGQFVEGSLAAGVKREADDESEQFVCVRAGHALKVDTSITDSATTHSNTVGP